MLPLTFYNGHRWSVWLNTNIVTTISMAFLGPLVVTIHTHKATLEDGSEKKYCQELACPAQAVFRNNGYDIPD